MYCGEASLVRLYAKARDKSEKAIVEWLRAHGATVWRLHEPVDLLVHYRDRWHVLECKTPGLVNNMMGPNGKMLKQKRLCELHHIPIVTTPEEALRAIGATEGRGAWKGSGEKQLIARKTARSAPDSTT